MNGVMMIALSLSGNKGGGFQIDAGRHRQHFRSDR
jgi:hypothetical protein